MLVYLIGSLKNPNIPILANRIRDFGFAVWDDWHAGGFNADREWQVYEQARGREYRDALYEGWHAWNTFGLDYKFLNEADVGVLVLPAGKSGHLELGYMLGNGKHGYVLMPGPPTDWDLMYRLADGVCYTEEELLLSLEEFK